MPYKSAQLYLHDPRASRHLIEALMEQNESQQSGGFFVLLEIGGETPQDKDFQSAFLETAWSAYQENLLHQSEQCLENVLNALNLLPQNFKNYEWQKKLNAFVGVMDENKVYFGAAGRIKVFLIRPLAIKDAIGKLAAPEKNILFDSTFSGMLAPGDRFLAACPSLTDYVALEKIKKIAGTLPVSGAVAHLHNILEAAPSGVSFLALLLQYNGESAPVEGSASLSETGNKNRIFKPTSSKNSLDQLLNTQAETEKILTVPGFGELIKNYCLDWLKFIKLRFKNFLPENKARLATRTAEQSKALKKRKELPPLLFKTEKNIIAEANEIAADAFARPRINLPTLQFRFKNPWPRKLTKAGKKIGLAVFAVIKFLFDKENRKQTLGRLNKLLVKALDYFKRLNKKQKIAFISLLVVLLVLSQSLIWRQKVVASLKLAQAISLAKAQINDKYNGMEASLIYKDSSRAQQLLKEIDGLIASFPETSKKLVKEKEDLKKQYNESFAKIWSLTLVSEPFVQADFSQALAGESIERLALNNNVLYAFALNGKTGVFDLKANQISSFNANLNGQVKALLGNANNQTILATSKNEFYWVKENSLVKIAVNLPAETKQIDDLAWFSGKMYILDKAAGQIFRLTQYGASFSSPIVWTKTDIEAGNLSSIGVDTYVYGLKGNNSGIIKLNNGKIDSTIALNIEPGLSANARMFTGENVKYFYIFDSAGKRLLVLQKDGTLLKQFMIKTSDNLAGFAIDEKQGLAYVSAGAKVYVINIK